MAIQKEEELYKPIKNYWIKQGFEVKGEVKHCDLVAIHPKTKQMIIVEMKKTLNLALLLQGTDRLRISDEVYLAVERNRKKSGAVNQRFGDVTELCRRIGLGLITVTFFKTKEPIVEVLCHPGDEPIRPRKVRKQKMMVQEFHERSGDYNIGGSHGKKLMTAYREKSLQCASAIAQLGQAAPREVASLTGIHSCGSILRNNYYGWFHKLNRGIYTLTETGTVALKQYQSIKNANQ